MNRVRIAGLRLLTILATLAWTFGLQAVFDAAPTLVLAAVLEAPIALGMAAAITNIRRALR